MKNKIKFFLIFIGFLLWFKLTTYCSFLISNPEDNMVSKISKTVALTIDKEQITDIRDNSTTILSEKFEVLPNKELPSPFNESIVLYNEEFNFPNDASHGSETIEIPFVRLDDNNIAHSIVYHGYQYYKDISPPGDKPVSFFQVKNYYYITYDPSSKKISSKIRVAKNDYSIKDLYIYNNTPFVLLQSNDDKEKYAYSFKDGTSFLSPILIQNQTVPELNSVSHLSKSSFQYISDPKEVVYLNGYFWRLDISSGKISRYPFSNGILGEKERISLNKDP